MQIVQGLGYLKDDEPFVLFSQHILAYERVQIDIHDFEEDIDVLWALGTNHLFYHHDIWMFEFR